MIEVDLEFKLRNPKHIATSLLLVIFDHVLDHMYAEHLIFHGKPYLSMYLVHE
jgi:hypothetical protein